MQFAETIRKRPDGAMDTSAAAAVAENGSPGDDNYEPWYDGSWRWGEPDYYSAEVNAMGYGKGKGKGKSYGGYGGGYSKGYGKGGDKGKGYGKGGYGGSGGAFGKGGDKGKGKGKGKDSGSGSVNIKRNAAGVAIFVGDCYECGLRGHSGRNCPSRGGQYAHHGACGKCGVYGHKVEVCPKQLEAVDVAEDAATKVADCVEAGGGSFEICGIEVNNRYACLATEDSDDDEEEKKSSPKKTWEDWRHHYQNLPAPQPTARMHADILQATRKAVWKLALSQSVTGSDQIDDFCFEIQSLEERSFLR